MLCRESICIAAILLAATLCAPNSPVAADEVVTFPSARYLVGSLQLRLASERGEPVVRAPAEMIRGYLSKPPGDGPFPAIVHLHGCGGLTAERRARDAEQFTSWDYVILEVDSFATRGIKDACAGQQIPARQADAMGALIYLSKVPFVDPSRIAVVGYSQGGGAVLNVASVQAAPLFEMPPNVKYKAAIAYYPICGAAADELTIPTLILVGELDDWTLAADCRRLMQRWTGKGAPLKLVIFPEAYHSFDNPTVSPYGTRFYGHWLRYNAEVTEQAEAMTRDFLAAELSR
jgi:dienelactone hydrolase